MVELISRKRVAPAAIRRVKRNSSQRRSKRNERGGQQSMSHPSACLSCDVPNHDPHAMYGSSLQCKLWRIWSVFPSWCAFHPHNCENWDVSIPSAIYNHTMSNLLSFCADMSLLQKVFLISGPGDILQKKKKKKRCWLGVVAGGWPPLSYLPLWWGDEFPNSGDCWLGMFNAFFIASLG